MVEGNHWPNNAQCIAMPTVNLDGDEFWLGMFPDSITRPKTLSMGEYGIKRGLDRVLATFKQFDIKTTFFVPGKIAERYPEAIEKIIADHHEIAMHGHSHRSMVDVPLAELEEEIERGKEIITQLTGSVPKGFRAPEGELTLEHLQLIQRLGFTYSSSLYGDDRLYSHWFETGELVEIPIQWELHDFPYFAFNYGPAFPIGQGRVASYAQVTGTYQKEFDGYYHYGLAYVAQFTPQSIGSPGRIKILEDVLHHISQFDEVWIGTCQDLINQVHSLSTSR